MLSWLRAGQRGLNRLSWTTTVTVVMSFVTSVVLLSAVTPLFIRYALLPNVVNHRQQLDFTFRTCDDQLSGICSYPEAVFDLSEEAITLSPNYYYTFILTLELFDSTQNNQLGVFQAQVSPKNIEGKTIASFKKQIIFRQSFFSRIYHLIRNTCFFPLYIIGYFTQSDNTIGIKITNQFLEKRSNPTAFIAVQLQNKFVQVADAYLDLGAHVGISGYLLSEFPVLSYLCGFGICFTINFGLFFIYWTNKGIKVFADDDIVSLSEKIDEIGEKLEKDISESPNSNDDSQASLVSLLRGTLSPLRVFSSPPPESAFEDGQSDAWNRDELPENIPFDANIPGWSIDNEKKIEKVSNGNVSTSKNGKKSLRKRRDSVRIAPQSQVVYPSLVN